MREFEQIICVHVVSEPGDMTHYDFAMHKLGDDISIMPLNNNFRYPQKLNYWAVLDIIKHKNDNQVIELSERFNCNPNTLLEVCNSIVDYWEER